MSKTVEDDDPIMDSLKKQFAYLKDFEPIPGCPDCGHEMINCRNHTHCSSLGMELICYCSTCGGTGRSKEDREKRSN